MTPTIINAFSPDYISQLAPMRDVKIHRSVKPHPINNFTKNIALCEEGKRFKMKRASI